MRKQRVVRRIFGMKYTRKGLKDRNRHKNRIKKKEWASSVVVCQIQNLQHSYHLKVSLWELVKRKQPSHKQFRYTWLDYVRLDIEHPATA